MICSDHSRRYRRGLVIWKKIEIGPKLHCQHQNWWPFWGILHLKKHKIGYGCLCIPLYHQAYLLKHHLSHPSMGISQNGGSCHQDFQYVTLLHSYGLESSICYNVRPPFTIAKLVHITTITMVYGSNNHSSMGLCSPTYNVWGHLHMLQSQFCHAKPYVSTGLWRFETGEIPQKLRLHEIAVFPSGMLWMSMCNLLIPGAIRYVPMCSAYLSR